MSFQLAHLKSQSMPHVEEKDGAEDEAFYNGALLVETGGGEYAEIADPFTVGQIDGVALHRYGVDRTDPYAGTPSFDITGGIGINPGRVLAIQLGQGDRNLLFSAQYVGTLPEQTGGSYGVIRDTDGRWKVNFANTTNGVVRLESLAWTEDPINKGRVIVSFLEAE